MNIFKAIGVVTESIVNVIIKGSHALETVAEATDEAAGIVLDATKQMREEQQAELAKLKRSNTRAKAKASPKS